MGCRIQENRRDCESHETDGGWEMTKLNLSGTFKHIYDNKKEINEKIEILIENWEKEDEKDE